MTDKDNATQMQHPENDAQYTGLQVNAGVEQPPIVSPYIKNRKRRKQLSVSDYVEGIRKGDKEIGRAHV